MVQLGEVAPAATLSHTFPLSLFPATSALWPPEAERLYQLGVSRCPPQSSIEGLEDVEVGFNASRHVICLYPDGSYWRCCFDHCISLNPPHVNPPSPPNLTDKMQNARAAAGGARGPHPGHGRRGPEHEERRRGHPGLCAGEGDAGSLQGGQRTRDDQTGAVSGRVRRGLLPGVQVSAVAMVAGLSSSIHTCSRKQMGFVW